MKQLLAFSMIAMLAVTGRAFSDGHDDEPRVKSMFSSDVKPVANAAYQRECGSCHMAYQPGFLPKRSWHKLLGTLDNHFGENAELTSADRDSILPYLEQNAADTSGYKRSRRIMSSLKATDVPRRISETPYIVHKHEEIPARAVGPTAKIKNLSQCQMCHAGAEKGSYNEHDVVIPGFGRWRD